ncbi:MAG TPA: hypothetical protein VHX42_02020 [Candidatus Babeliales bacterium]|jgi:hypothetical protein|nr:hypothetical protein [Candidatus Babeliales bacterium]
MKSTKNVLIAGIALAITLFASIQITAMETVNGTNWQNLPTEIRSLIIMTLAESHNNLDEAIKNIKQMSEINKELYSVINGLKSFTALVHILEDKFDVSTEDIAKKFSTPTAKQYIDLGNKLFNTMVISYSQLFIAQVTKYINTGADINFSKTSSAYAAKKITILDKAVDSQESQKIALILKFGAKPDQALSRINHSPNTEPWVSIKQMLQDAIEKNKNK